MIKTLIRPTLAENTLQAKVSMHYIKAQIKLRPSVILLVG